MTLDDYIKELEADLKFDEINLKDYQMKLPGIKHKWAGRCIRHKIELNKLKKEREKLKKIIKTKLEKDSVVKISTQVASKTAEESDLIATMDNKIYELELVIELLEKSEKTLSSTSFDLRNLLEIMKLETT